MSDIKELKKPLFLVKPGAISPPDIERAQQECGICIVECTEPESVRLLEPPIDSGMDVQAKAALSLARMVVYDQLATTAGWSRGAMIEFFVRHLMEPMIPTVTKVKR